MKNFKITLALLAIALGLAMPTEAKEKVKYSVSTDLVSSYVWRGFVQGTTHGGTPNIQPTANMSYKKLTIGAWGSGSFDGEIKEVDLYATYALSDIFSITATDYNYTFSTSYFDYSKETTNHIVEGSLNYAGVKKFPLSVSVNTMLYGADKDIKGDNAFSTYIELTYPISENTKLFLGGLYLSDEGTSNGYAFDKKGFNICNAGIKISKEIKFSDSFNLPLYGILGTNPATENAYFVVEVTF